MIRLPTAGKPGSNSDLSPPKISPASCNGPAPPSTTSLRGGPYSARVWRGVSFGERGQAVTRISIADWAFSVSTRSFEVAPAEIFSDVYEVLSRRKARDEFQLNNHRVRAASGPNI